MQKKRGDTDVCLEIINAYIHPFDHIQKVCSQNEGSAWMVEHARRMLELLKVFQPGINIVRQFQQPIISSLAVKKKK